MDAPPEPNVNAPNPTNDESQEPKDEELQATNAGDNPTPIPAHGAVFRFFEQSQFNTNRIDSIMRSYSCHAAGTPIHKELTSVAFIMTAAPPGVATKVYDFTLSSKAHVAMIKAFLLRGNWTPQTRHYEWMGVFASKVNIVGDITYIRKDKYIEDLQKKAQNIAPTPLSIKEQHILDNRMDEFLRGTIVGNCSNCFLLGTTDSTCRHCRDSSYGIFCHTNWAVLVYDQRRGQTLKRQNPHPLDIAQINWSDKALAESFLKQCDPQTNSYPPNGPQPMRKFSAPLTHVVTQAARFGNHSRTLTASKISKIWQVTTDTVLFMMDRAQAP